MSGVHDEQRDVLLDQRLAESGRKLLLEVLVLDARKLDDDGTISLDAVEDVEGAEDGDVTDCGNIGLLNGIRCLDGVVGVADVDAGDTAADKVVVALANKDILR